MSRTIAEALLAWYDLSKREMPWRDISNPYATWVSETMLQQTRVETVMRYYDRFMTRFPTVHDLAQAPLDEVLKMWEGLGYYRRARNLHAGAQQVDAEFHGVLPRDVHALLQIKGIGAYTAGAIASIAYGQAVPAVDGNVIRVICRVCGIRENAGAPSVQRQIAGKAQALISRERPGDFNQALMDLGATLCVPGTPDCESCPLREMCSAHAEGDESELPQLPRKTPPKLLDYDVCLVMNGNRFLMRKRAEAMLQGLWVFPMLPGHTGEKQLPQAVRRMLHVKVEKAESLGEARHVFTHQVWQMKLYALRTPEEEAPGGWRYVSCAEMEQLTIPTAMRAAVKCARQLSGEE